MIEERVEVKTGDLLILHTGWHRFSQFGADARRGALHPHAPRARTPTWCRGCSRRRSTSGAWTCVSTDHPMNLPIGRFLGKGMHGHCDRVRAGARGQVRRPRGGRASCSPTRAYQLTHNALFPNNCMHIENLGGEIDAPELQNRRLILGCFPWKFRGGEAAFARVVAFTGEWKP